MKKVVLSLILLTMLSLAVNQQPTYARGRGGYILGGAGIIGASILGSAIINSNRPIYTYPPVIYQSPVIVPMSAQQPMTQLVYVNVNGQLVPYYFINGQLIPVGR